MPILTIIAIALAFVAGAEIQKFRLRKEVDYKALSEKYCDTLWKNFEKVVDQREQCESALIKQTNEHQNNITAERRREVASRKKPANLGGLQDRQPHRIRVREGV